MKRSREKGRPRRWRRLLLRGVLVLIGLAIGVRIALPFALPMILDHLVAPYGLELRYDDLDLDLLCGDLELRSLVVAPREGGEPVLELDYLRLDTDPLSILGGAFEVVRCDLDGLRLRIEREADGRVPLLERFAGERAESAPAIEPPTGESAGGALLELPVAVREMRLGDVRIRVRDRDPEEPIDAEVRLALSLSELCVPSAGKTRFALAIEVPAIVPRLVLEGRATLASEAVHGEFALDLEGLRTEPLRRHLERLGWRPEAGEISCSLRAEGRALRAGAEGLEAALEVSSAHLDTDGERRLVLERLRVSGAREGSGEIRRGELEAVLNAPGILERARLRASLQGRAEGTDLRLDALLAGLDARPLAPWLEPLGVEPLLAQGRVHLGLEGMLEEVAGGGFAGDFKLGPVEVSEGSHSLGTIQRLALRGLRIPPAGTPIELAELGLAGVELRARKEADGSLVALGMRWRAGAAGGQMSAKPGRPPAPPAPPAAKALGPPALSLARLGIEKVHLVYEDASTLPAATIELADLSLALEDLRTDRPLAQTPPGRLRGALRLPGLVESLALDGEVRAATDGLRAALRVEGEGVTARAAARWLEPLGLRSELAAGQLELALSAAMRSAEDGARALDFELKTLELRDGGRELLNIAGLGMRGLRPDGLAGGEPLLVIDDLHLESLRSRLALQSDGGLRALGFHLRPASSAETPPPPAPAEPAGGQPAPAITPAPILRLGGLRIGEVALEIERPAAGEQPLVHPLRLSARLGPMSWDPGATGAGAETPFRADLKLPGSAEDIVLEGAAAPWPAGLRIHCELTGSGIATRAFSDLLARSGLRADLTEGALHLALESELSRGGGALAGSARLSALRFEEGGVELAGLDELRLEGLHLEGRRTRVGSLTLDHPRLLIGREVGAGMSFAGFELAPVAAPVGTEATAQGRAPGGASEPASAPVSAPAEGSGGVSSLELGSLKITDGVIALVERGAAEEHSLRAHVDVALDDLALGGAGAPARLVLDGRIEDALERLRLSGELSAGARSQGAELELDAQGLRTAALAWLFPPGARPILQSGRLRAKLSARVDAAGGGASSLRARVSGFDLREGARGPALLEAAELAVTAPHIGADRIAVSELRLSGLEAGIERTPAGALRVAGLELAPQAAPLAGAASSRPATRSAPAVSAPAPAPTPAALPKIEIEQLALELKRLEFRDHLGGAPGEPLSASAELHNEKPLVLLGEHPGECEPLALHLRASAAPFFDELDLGARLQPFAASAYLGLDLSVRGIDGEGVLARVPELGGAVSQCSIRDGELRGKLDLQVRLDRRDPLALDLQSGFGLNGTLSELQLLSGGKVLAGLDELIVRAEHLDPAAGRMHFERVELDHPVGAVTRRADGLCLLGLTLAAPNEEQSAAGDDAGAGAAAPRGGESSTAAETAQPAPAAKPMAAEPMADVQVETLLVSRAALSYRDETCDPPLVIPIADAEIEVNGLSNLAVEAPPPLQFDVVVQAGDVTLPKRSEEELIPGAGRVIGLFQGVAELAVGSLEEEPEPEQRALFQDLTLRGGFTFQPRPVGRAELELSGFELGALKGLAARSQIEINDGVVDSDIKVHGKRAGALDTKSEIVFTHLALAEPPGGPIQRFLHLPASLDMVIFALRDDAGALRIPVAFEAQPEGLGQGQIIGMAIEALARVIVRAFQRSPFRAAGFVFDLGDSLITRIPLVGSLWTWLTSTGPDAEDLAARAVEFAPADASLDAAARAKLKPLAELLGDYERVFLTLRPEVGSLDRERCRILANPSRPDVEALVQRLQRSKLSYEHLRRIHALQAERSLGAGRAEQAGEEIAQLNRIDEKIGRIEADLDAAQDFLGGDADRMKEQRLRLLATELAHQRQRAVRRALLDLAGDLSSAEREALSGRIRLTRPRVGKPTHEGGGRVRILPGLRRGG